MSGLEGWYRPIDHATLYNQLKAANPKQIDGMVADWQRAVDTATGLATSLNADLAKLTAGWADDAGQEYQRRLGLIAQFSQTLADRATQIKVELAGAAADVRAALAENEPPANPDNTTGSTLKGAAIGSLFGPVGTVTGGLIGNELGRQQDEEERQKAHDRIVKVVADLAVELDLASQRWPQTIELPPVDMPGTVNNSGAGNAAAATGAAAGAVLATRATATRSSSTGAGPTGSPSSPGDTSVGTDPANDTFDPDNPPSTSLAGADDAALGGASASVLGGLTAGVYNTSQPLGSANAIGAAGAFGAMMPGNSAGGAAGALGTPKASATSASHLLGGRGAPGTAGGPNAGPGADARNASAAAGGRGLADGEGNEERVTWLSEEDAVWGLPEDLAPPVLGVYSSDPDQQ